MLRRIGLESKARFEVEMVVKRFHKKTAIGFQTAWLSGSRPDVAQREFAGLDVA